MTLQVILILAADWPGCVVRYDELMKTLGDCNDLSCMQ